jgi:YfiH family protein
MKKIVTNGLTYWQFESFDPEIVSHGFFTRKGGVSPEPWASLNQGGTVGDVRENVVENRRRIFATLKRPVESIFDAWQVHGNDVICTDLPRPLDEEHQKADAIVTDHAEITLFMRFADCVPILMYDPSHRVVSITHAGWKGTLNQIVAETIRAMKAKYKSRPEEIVAGIGPSIGVCHYQVGQEVYEAAQANFSGNLGSIFTQKEDKWFLNLWEANTITLEKCGVKKIEIANICTACHTEDWYSHRAEKGKTGRFAATLNLVAKGNQ